MVKFKESPFPQLFGWGKCIADLCTKGVAFWGTIFVFVDSLPQWIPGFIHLSNLGREWKPKLNAKTDSCFAYFPGFPISLSFWLLAVLC